MVLHGLAGVSPIEALQAVTFGHVDIAILSLFCVITLSAWRLWKFTILPILYPNDPKELPYWIPVVGHALPFFSNSQNLLTHAREYFGNTREPFTITVAGNRLSVLTKAKDVVEAYRNNTTLTFDEFVKAMMRTFGSSRYCVEAMYKYMPHAPHDKDFPNPYHKPLGKLARDMHIEQLFPGERLNDLGNRFVNYFHDSLGLEQISIKPYATHTNSNSAVVPLLKWASDVLTLGGQRAYFGPLLEEIDPNMTWTFLEFDELSWQVLYQYPKFISRRMNFLKDKLIEDLDTYYNTPQDKRTGDAWFTKAFEHEARQIGIGTHDLATMMVQVYWGINTNTRKACFWMLAYTIYNPEFIDIIRTETKAAFDDCGRVNFHYLNESCPQLGAIWDETIRMTAYSASVRHVTADTIIGGKTMQKNDRVMIPYRQLHFNEDIFGKGIHQFDRERFLKNGTLHKSSSWRPFGGGTTMCPGRYVAKQTVLTMVATLLQRFDVELVESVPFPRFEEGKPVLGIMSNKEGDDPLVRIRERKL